MKTIGEVLKSLALSPHLAAGDRLLLWQQAAEAALTQMGMAPDCQVAGADGDALELRVGNAAMAARFKQAAPSFLAAFNRAAGTDMKTVRVRVALEGG